ncbi:hypothetical protein AYO47_05840 [Planctomyces sp. SCGC AG-212-M04]|nr:hypothetical protein AYO47_05840 [Planctomyces sp. SCGC AG-212-M04]
MTSGRFRFGQLLAILVLSGWAAGCGQSTYAERVNRSAKVLAYHNVLDQNLQGEWARGDWGLAMRPPAKFTLKPAPPPPKTSEEGVTEVVVDSRQPTGYLGVEFPGLVAAWEIPGEAMLYLCSNHQRFIDSQGSVSGADPEAFFMDLETVLQQGFKFSLSADPARGPTELHAKFPERIPASDEFAPPKDFKSIRIEKKGDPSDKSDPSFSANVYEIESGKIKAAIILVYSPSNPGNFDNMVRIALETLRVDPIVPRAAPTPGTTGATGTGAPRPAAF